MEIKVQIKGVEEVSAMLRKLPDTLREKYAKRGMQEGAETIVAAVKSRIPSATGLARESIGASKIKYYEHSGTLFAAVEPQKGFKRIVTSTATGKKRIHGRKTMSATADFGRVQDPRRYMHIIEKGRKAVVVTTKRALHSALDIDNRFFMHAKAVGPHPVFAPAAAAVSTAVRIAIEIELERGIQEFNATTT